jgi:hypothetical protein
VQRVVPRLRVHHPQDRAVRTVLHARLGRRDGLGDGVRDGESVRGAVLGRRAARGRFLDAARCGVEARGEAEAAVVLGEGLGLVPGGSGLAMLFFGVLGGQGAWGEEWRGGLEAWEGCGERDGV